MANACNICFNIRSILLNSDVKTVCQALLAVLKLVESTLNECKGVCRNFASTTI